MNRTRFVLCWALGAALTSSFSAVQAQQNQDQTASPPPRSAPSEQNNAASGTTGMMRMMNDPAHQTAMAVFMLPELKDELGLSAQQVSDLRQAKQDVLAKAKDLTNDAKAKELDATFVKMKAFLTEEQRGKLAAIKPIELHEYAMSRLPMDEHRVMAGFSGGMMMHGGMMHGKGMGKR